MLRRPQMIDGLMDIIKDSKLILPDRRWTLMYDCPQMQYSREMANMEMLAKKKQNARILREEVIETARDTNVNVPDVNHVAEAMQRMNAMGTAQREQQESLNRMNMQQQAQQAQESRAVLERKAAEMNAQRTRDRMAAEVTRVHTHAMHEDLRSRQ